jgi:flagellar protein FliS
VRLARRKEAPSPTDKLLWVDIMWNNGHDAYLESRVLSADPIELVNMLYQGCMQAVREARLHLAEGRIADRSREITKACQIVIELAVSLDHERGGEISRRLALLYDYMHRRLLEANMRQSDEPLADVLGLLSTLAEGWEGIRTSENQRAAECAPAPQPAAENAWSQSVADSAWSSQPAVEHVWSQPVTQSPWSPLAAENAQSSQPATGSVWSQPAAESPWSQLGVTSSSEPVTDNPWAPPAPESPWAQPVPQEGDYRLRAFSF